MNRLKHYNSLFVLIFLLFLPSVVFGFSTTDWNYPWEPKEDKNLHKLLNEGYKIIDTSFNFFEDDKSYVEVIYLEKQNEVYKCITHMPTKNTMKDVIKHWCELCVSPGLRTVDDDNISFANIKMAFLAAKVFFEKNPNGIVTVEKLKENHLVLSENVILIIEVGTSDKLKMSAHHFYGKKKHIIDSMGNITTKSRW